MPDDLPIPRPQAPDADTEALATVEAHVQLLTTKGGAYIFDHLNLQRDIFASQTLDDPRLNKKERRERHISYLTLRDFLKELEADFQAALLHLHGANKLAAELTRYITARPEPEEVIERNIESANPFGGGGPPPPDEPQPPPAS